MNVQTLPAKEWLLLAKDADGKEVEVGRFVTDALAIDYVNLYRITDWRLKRVSSNA